MSEFPWEDGLLERKVESDLKDLLKTLVAFANSVRPGHVATLLIGEKDDGTAAGVINPDAIQKKVRDECEKIYPDIIWRSQIYKKEGKHCVRVEIEYSGDTPHFGGAAWVRRGTSSVKATDEVFQRLIDLRSDVVREISKWVGSQVSVTLVKKKRRFNKERHARIISASPNEQECEVKLISVNKFWVTYEFNENNRQSSPLEDLTLSYDNRLNRLHLTIRW